MKLRKQTTKIYRFGWVAGPNQMNQNQWIRADFIKPFKITAIQTQGRAFSRESHYTKSYKISYSFDEIQWTVYKNTDGSEKVYVFIDYLFHFLIFLII